MGKIQHFEPPWASQQFLGVQFAKNQRNSKHFFLNVSWHDMEQIKGAAKRF